MSVAQRKSEEIGSRTGCGDVMDSIGRLVATQRNFLEEREILIFFECHYSAFVLGLVLYRAGAGREGESAHG